MGENPNQTKASEEPIPDETPDETPDEQSEQSEAVDQPSTDQPESD